MRVIVHRNVFGTNLLQLASGMCMYAVEPNSLSLHRFQNFARKHHFGGSTWVRFAGDIILYEARVIYHRRLEL